MYDFSSAIRNYLLPLSGTTRLVLRRKAELFLRGQRADALYFIERGMVKLDRSGEADQCVTLNLCSDGEILGEESLLPHEVYLSQAEALTPLTLYRIPSVQVIEAGLSDSRIAMFLLETALRRKQLIERRLEVVAGNDVERRILLCLADLAEHGEREMDGAYTLPLTQRDVANLIGATRETTSLMLNQMEREGLLSLTRGRITIPSAARLRDAAVEMNVPAAAS